MLGGFDQLRPPAMHWSSDSFHPAMPVLWDSSGIDIDGVFKPHVVGHIVGSCLEMCVGPMF